jgi:hypothetical protein
MADTEPLTVHQLQMLPYHRALNDMYTRVYREAEMGMTSTEISIPRELKLDLMMKAIVRVFPDISIIRRGVNALHEETYLLSWK